jgi:phosphoglycerol transferase MdoB-like AlkP superfamily enzyme
MPSYNSRFAMRNLFKQSLPYLIVFLVLQFALRVMFAFESWSNIEPSGLFTVLSAFGKGLIYDIPVFGVITSIMALYFIIRPISWAGSRKDLITRTIMFSIFVYVMLFTFCAEILFWREFEARFNFIAVDYLVYTREVIGNIRESYPITLILSILAAITVSFTFVYYRKFKEAPAMLLSIRAKYFFCAVIMTSFFIYNLDSSKESFNNRYINEIGKNGFFELFSAFQKNELDFERFYITANSEEVLHLLQKKLGILEPGSSPIERLVPARDASKPSRKHNIVIITVESLSAEYLSAFGNTNNLTPYLNKLVGDSLLFTNLHATGTRTVYGLAAITLSMPPLPGNSIVRRPNNANLFSLGSVLNSQGYVSKFIYGGYGYFDNMNAFFAANGYEIIDRSNLSADEVTFANIWGVCDEDLLNKVLKEGDKAHAEDKPFFNMVMTTSNHRPYTYPEGKIDIPSGKGRDGGVKYTDYAIGQFIKQAHEKPWFDNTIFVIVADHTAGSAGKNELNPEKYLIPLVIYAPKIAEPGIYSDLASQIDVAPTVLGYLNFAYNSKFYGEDLLQQNPERVFISNYQKVAYLNNENMVILKPGKKASYYKHDNHGEWSESGADEKLLLDALSFYQNANNWRVWSAVQP